MAAFEGAEAARATATGMAAVHTGGDRPGEGRRSRGRRQGAVRLVPLGGGGFLPRFGVASTLVNGIDLDQWRDAVRPNTKMFFLESPTNPTLEVLDIAAIAEIAHEAGATLVVDNVFATPIFQSPLALGADCVVYSATKHIDGQGRCLGGIILASEKFIQEHIHNLLRQTGPRCRRSMPGCCSRGWRRCRCACAADRRAATIAVPLAEHPKITRLIYPGRADHPQAAVAQKQMRGGSNLVAFEVAGGKAAAFRFLNALQLLRITNNLGDAKSLVTHPATTTHQRLTPGAARRTRYHRRHRAPVGRARTCRRHRRRCAGRARGGVSLRPLSAKPASTSTCKTGWPR